jgi:tetratricopeptide (TPR) repeat protein
MINQALVMEPENGLYYYGRGRVFLLSGDKDRAMDDFKKAAALEDEDAINYLKYLEQTSN